MAVDIDPSDNSELIGKAGEKVMVVRQRQDSFNRVEITADGDVKVGTGYTAPVPMISAIASRSLTADKLEPASNGGYSASDPAFAGGAKGDNIQDDYPALQAAINAACTAKTRLKIGAGTFKLSQALVIPYSNGWSLEGAGAGSTTLMQYTNNTPVFSFPYTHTHTYEISRLGVTWNTQQTTANTQSVGFAYNNVTTLPAQIADGVQAGWGHWDFSIHHINFRKGYTGIGQIDSGAQPNPVWSCRWHDLDFSGTDWVGPALKNENVNGGSPNVNIHDVYIRCESLTAGPVLLFGGMHDSVISSVEVNNCTLPIEWAFNTCHNVYVTNIKSEFGTINGALSPYQGLISVGNSQVFIKGYAISSKALNSPGAWHHAVRASSTGSYIEIDNLTIDSTAPIAGQWTALSCVGGSSIKRGFISGFTYIGYAGKDLTYGMSSVGRPVYPVSATATTATAGGGAALPATVLGYIIAEINEVSVKIPYYAN